jgi:hypothetical protein
MRLLIMATPHDRGFWLRSTHCQRNKIWEPTMGVRKLVNVVLSGLPGELQDIREKRGLTLEVVCDPLEWQQSKLSRMENGIQCISRVDLGSLFAVYQVTGEDRKQQLLHMADRQDDPGRWETDSPAAEESPTLTRLERRTTAIVDVAPMVIPELVQTADYARAVMESDGVPAEHLTARVRARMARQSILAKNKPPKLDLIVGEAALRLPVGGSKVMVQQLHALLELARHPDVRLRTVPFAVGGDAGLYTAFSVMEFPGKKAVVYLPLPTTSLFLERPDKVEAFRSRVARLARVALEPAKSTDLIESIARDFELTGHTNDGPGTNLRTRAAR